MLGIALALVAGGVVVWRSFAPAGRMEVQLLFIGYTNTPFTAPWCARKDPSMRCGGVRTHRPTQNSGRLSKWCVYEVAPRCALTAGGADPF